jgi:DNA-binding NtrC family response regulator
MARILVIDDNDELGGEVQAGLELVGHDVTHVDCAERGLELVTQQEFDIIILDNRMPRMTGLDFLIERKRREIRIPPVIFMTGKGDTDTAIRALKLGAFNYLDKPDTYAALVEELIPLIVEALKIDWRPKPVVTAPAAPKADGPRMLWKSPPMKEVVKKIAMVAGSNDPVLILGETGTGKELVARAIHTHNELRQSRPFAARNCTAFTETLLDSELFGHEKGAFSEAYKMRKGVFEHANGGTVFLDEVGDMLKPMQAKLLRVLEYGEFTRVGGNELIKVDVRIVSATNRNLEAAIRKDEFRQDLFYRLKGVTIQLPPLRERGEDLRLLTDYFIQKSAERNGCPVPTLHPNAWAKLKTYSWPGNIRELTNVLGGAVLMSGGRQIMAGDLELRGNHESDAGDTVAALRQIIRSSWDSGQDRLWPHLRDLLERELLRHAREEGGNNTQIAERLKMNRGTVIKRLQKYKLE